MLAGYGAEAVHPYLAMETLANMHRDLPADLSAEKAIYNYIKAIGKGLSKIMSKMGVSTYMSYCGAQLFEAIGLEKTMVDKYFRGTASQVGGIGVFQVAEEALRIEARVGQDLHVLLRDLGQDLLGRVLDQLERGRRFLQQGLADSGGAAKAMVAAGRVQVDGQQEWRKACKLRAGQVVAVPGARVRLRVADPAPR